MNAIINLKASIKAYPYLDPDTTVRLTAQNGIGPVDISNPSSGINVPTGTGSEKKLPPGGQWIRLVGVSVPDISSITKILGGALDKLAFAAKVVKKILSIVELFLSVFGSFSKAIAIFINIIQKQVIKLAKDLGNAGVYSNVILPPAFLKALASSNFEHMSTGGFNGFLVRLNGSLNDNTDNNRPRFEDEADVVGGFIFLIDTESMDDFFRALRTLSDLLDLKIDIDPPPPRNIRGYSGYFDDKGKQRFGLAVEWDAPSVPSVGYILARSRIPGGKVKVVNDIPTKIKDLIKAIWTRIVFKIWDWPQKTIHVYNDPDFNKGSPKIISRELGSGGGSFIDFDIPADTDLPKIVVGGYDEEGNPEPGLIPIPPHYFDAKNPFSPMFKEYFYVLQSGPFPWAPQSSELRVEVKTCDNSVNTTDVVQHEDGSMEFISYSFNLLNKWSKIQIKILVPWVTSLVKMLDKVLESIKGGFDDVSDAFIEMVKVIVETVETYIGIIRVLTQLLEELKKFLIGPSVAFLYVPPKEGGISAFMSQVRNAKPPLDGNGFSGPKGITGGIVFVIGYSLVGLSEKEKIELEKQWLITKTAFEFMSKMFKKD